MEEDSKKKEEICSLIDGLFDRLQGMALSIHQNPETSFEEYHACKVLTDFLLEEGFQVEIGVAEMETAFKASFQGGEGPNIAFLCEYDALPEVGHGCGHHLIGVASVGAAAALKRACYNLQGQILVIGTPAEEGGGGKILMVEKGIFKGVQGAMMFHPTTIEHQVLKGGTALLPVNLQYRGQSAHGAADPHKGINALDAILQVFHSINAMREHLKEDVRIHGYIKHGGVAANIVPDFAEAEFYLRSRSTKYLKEVVRPRFKAIAEAAALATGATLHYSEDLLFAERRYSPTLAHLFHKNLERLGERSPPFDPKGGSGSSDIGNVSLLLPTIHPYICITEEDIPHHSSQFMEAGVGPKADDALRIGAKALGMTGLDLFYHPEKLQEALEEHRSMMHL